MTDRPFIAFSQRDQTNQYGDSIDVLEQGYVEYFGGFDVDMIALSNAVDPIPLISRLPITHIILTGGNTVDITKGNGNTTLKGVSVKRDRTEKAMIEYAIENKIPVLGICRGAQFINTGFGGSLVDIQDKAHVRVDHHVDVVDESAKMFLGDKGVVNSYHDQTISSETLAGPLKCFAKCEDGTIEGIYHPEYMIAAIMWHPERPNKEPEFNEKIIKAFLSKTGFWRPRG